MPNDQESVLVVESCKPVAQVIAAALGDFFGCIVVANNLREVQALSGSALFFSVVVSNHALPNGSGQDLKAWLENQLPPERRPVAFVMMAGSLPGMRPSAAEDYIILPKPFLIEDLLAAIQEAKRLARLSRTAAGAAENETAPAP